MTFLAEAVDLPCRKSGIRVRIYSAPSNPSVVCSESSSVLSQPHRVGICMTLSMVTYLGILPRLIKRQQFLQTPRGTSLMEMEHYDRIALRTTSSCLQHRLDRARRLYALQWFFVFLFADNLDHPPDSHTWP
jgi:hypothetical protein